MLRGLAQRPERAARFLLGKVLVRRLGGRTMRARIVETEAYLAEGDPAAHAFRGRTARNAPVFGPPGTLYVYFVYGMHHCLNVAVDREGRAGCVLIRAVELLGGDAGDSRTASGPGRLTRQLEIDARLSGRYLFEPGSSLTLADGPRPRRIGVTRRVGIRQATERMLRFVDDESAAVSGPRQKRSGRSE